MCDVRAAFQVAAGHGPPFLGTHGTHQLTDLHGGHICEQGNLFEQNSTRDALHCTTELLYLTKGGRDDVTDTWSNLESINPRLAIASERCRQISIELLSSGALEDPEE